MRLAALVLAATLAFAGGAGAAERRPLQIALSLVVDVSGSINDYDFILQRDSYASLVRDPRIVPANGTVALNFIYYASDAVMVVDWMVIDGPDAAAAFADRIMSHGRLRGILTTSISHGVVLAAESFRSEAFDRLPKDSLTRKVIDVSGDGENVAGPDMASARALALEVADTINGLPMGIEPQVMVYYRDQVIGGAGAFMMPAETFADFGRALRAKLKLEISGAPEPPAGPPELPPPPGHPGG